MLVYVDIDILKNSIQELEQKKQNEKMNVRMSLYLRWKEGKVSFKELKWRHTQFAITSIQKTVENSLKVDHQKWVLETRELFLQTVLGL